MEELFIKDLEFNKRAGASLDRDSTKWTKQVISDFLFMYPQLQNQVLGLNWIKKDETKGYAVGILKALNGVIPVIINAFKLSPLDVIMFGEVALPLTKDTLDELTNSPSPFKGLEKVRSKQSLDIFGDRVQWSPVDYSGVTPAYQGSLIRDAVKVASFIDRIEHTDKEAVKEILHYVRDNPNIATAMEKNGHMPILQKLANMNYLSKDDTAEAYLRSLDVDRQFIYTDKEGNKFLKQANSKIDFVWAVPLDEDDKEENIFNNKDLEKEAEWDLYTTTCNPVKGESGFFSLNGNRLTEDLQILGVEKLGGLQDAILRPYLDNSGSLAIFSDGSFAECDGLQKYARSNVESKGNDPKVGDYGVLEIQGHVTKPFTVLGLSKYAADNADHFEIKTDQNLNIITYKSSRGSFSGLQEDTMEKNAYYVPFNSKFIKLGNRLPDNNITRNTLIKMAHSDNKYETRIDCLESMEKRSYYLTKDASGLESLGNNEYRLPADSKFITNMYAITKVAELKTYSNIVKKDSIGSYYLSGTEFDKYANAHKVDNLDKNSAIWAAVHCGASSEDIEKISSLKNNEQYYIKNKLNVPLPLGKVKQGVEKYAEQVSNKFEKVFNINLIKEASVMSDQSTVDAILSLGLMKKYNVLEYLQLIPDYEKVTGELAKLLIMVRLGLVQVPEVAVKVAMETLMSVVTSLKQLQSIIQNSELNNNQ